jgi:hypothetical protein
MRQFVAVLQPFKQSGFNSVSALPYMVFRGKLDESIPFDSAQLPHDQMLTAYCQRYPGVTETVRHFTATARNRGLSHIVWDGGVKDLLKLTPKDQRKGIKAMLREAVAI